jgi:hypothetical protein
VFKAFFCHLLFLSNGYWAISFWPFLPALSGHQRHGPGWTLAQCHVSDKSAILFNQQSTENVKDLFWLG